MNRHTLSVLVEDQPGVLARISALFSRRGFNIDSLAVGPTELLASIAREQFGPAALASRPGSSWPKSRRLTAADIAFVSSGRFKRSASRPASL